MAMICWRVTPWLGSQNDHHFGGFRQRHAGRAWGLPGRRLRNGRYRKRCNEKWDYEFHRLTSFSLVRFSGWSLMWFF